jgi:prephenate dehydrogenase
MKLKNTNLLIVGLGLLGGSYARALTKRGYRVHAIEINPDSLAYALDHGIIASGSTTPDPDLVGAADLVIFALYPHVLFEWLEQNQHLLKAGALLTDVTGVKGAVVDRVQRLLRPDLEFIAAHPMAGREVGGVENSDERIFHGANYIVVPTERNTPAAIERCRKLGEELGFARISCLSPAEHDEMIAFVSQLTHCIAISLMTCNRAEHLEAYTGDSFRDLTRIARINDEMWSELFLLNRDALLRQIDHFSSELNILRGYLESGDREHLRELMRFSTARRALFDKPKPEQ